MVREARGRAGVFEALAEPAGDDEQARERAHLLVGEGGLLDAVVQGGVGDGGGGRWCSPRSNLGSGRRFGAIRRAPTFPAVSFLDALASYAPLSPDERALLGSFLTPHALAAGETFFRAGEVCHRIAFVRAGVMRAHVLTDGGDDVTTYFTEEGGMICDYDSFLNRTPSRLYLSAATDCELEVLSRAGVEAAYAKTRHGERLGRRVAEALATASHRRVMRFYLDDPERRYRDFVAEQPGVAARVPQYHIASYVGVRPQSLSRIRARMGRGEER